MLKNRLYALLLILCLCSCQQETTRSKPINITVSGNLSRCSSAQCESILGRYSGSYYQWRVTIPGASGDRNTDPLVADYQLSAPSYSMSAIYFVDESMTQKIGNTEYWGPLKIHVNHCIRLTCTPADDFVLIYFHDDYSYFLRFSGNTNARLDSDAIPSVEQLKNMSVSVSILAAEANFSLLDREPRVIKVLN